MGQVNWIQVDLYFFTFNLNFFFWKHVPVFLSHENFDKHCNKLFGVKKIL